ncbi:hypothetical protein EAI_11993 [Harpegnathos saltator]|uniref:Uncharacterized protein n=1 Tax=Harpegnathos saltator TaxID=610380 RepID=E2BLV8_HARSA|nr:hypothetical protein EAI_11993 [Harpegnathos saltator]
MTPTQHDEEIEGRSYKDYVYSPVPVSSSSAVFDANTPGKESVQLNAVHGKELCRTSSHVVDTRYPEDMTEKGSTFVQFLAAAAVRSPSCLCFIDDEPSKEIP